MNKKLKNSIIICVMFMTMVFSSCSDKLYYSHVLYGEIFLEKKIRNQIRAGQSPPNSYLLVLKIKNESNINEIYISNEALYQYLKKILSFENYGEFIDFILTKLLKDCPVEIRDKTVYESLSSNSIKCDSCPDLNNMSSRDIMNKIKIDSVSNMQFLNGLNEDFGCIIKNLLKSRNVFVCTKPYYQGYETYYYYYYKTPWILTDGHNPTLKYDVRGAMGLDLGSFPKPIMRTYSDKKYFFVKWFW